MHVYRLPAGGMGGRLDHTLSALSTLHKWRHLNLVLWGEGNMAQLLPPGKHIIRSAKGFEGPCCGLVPLNGPATLTSTGLKWNLGTASTLALVYLSAFLSDEDGYLLRTNQGTTLAHEMSICVFLACGLSL